MDEGEGQNGDGFDGRIEQWIKLIEEIKELSLEVNHLNSRLQEIIVKYGLIKQTWQTIRIKYQVLEDWMAMLEEDRAFSDGQEFEILKNQCEEIKKQIDEVEAVMKMVEDEQAVVMRTVIMKNFIIKKKEAKLMNIKDHGGQS